MDYLNSIILGIIQGVTEFLPISSSGHLFLAHQWLGFDLADNLAFDVFLHVGTLFALLIFFAKDICRLFKAWITSLCRWRVKTDADQKLAWLIILGCVPAGLVGFFGETWLEKNFYGAVSVAAMLIIVGLLMLLVERWAKQNKTIEQLTWRKTLMIGVGQALALIPGVSRSGITIIAGMSLGLKREAAARFSFLLAIPIVAAAAVKKLLDYVNAINISAGITIDGGLEIHRATNELALFIIGGLAAAVVGWLSIKVLLQFLARYPLNVFAYYRIVLGLIILALFIF